jgi:hypothetical protein
MVAAAFKAGWNPSLDAWREYFIPLPVRLCYWCRAAVLFTVPPT